MRRHDHWRRWRLKAANELACFARIQPRPNVSNAAYAQRQVLADVVEKVGIAEVTKS
jgi:hypothetical protein